MWITSNNAKRSTTSGSGLNLLLALSMLCCGLSACSSYKASSPEAAAIPGIYQLPARKTPQPLQDQAPRHEQSADPQLTALAGLHEAGLISDRAFEAQRESLLDETRQAVRGSTNTLAHPRSAQQFRGVKFGKFHALVVGNNHYRHFPHLKTAVNDARTVADLLRDQYGFTVTTLLDSSRYALAKALSQLRTTLTEDDNLLIYYAGHGYLDTTTGRGYWLPVDAEEDNTANWMSTTDVTDSLHGMASRHVMVIADSCYSGTLTRATFARLDERTELIKRLVGKRSRTVLSSGGLEPVLDSGDGNHSVFAEALLSVLTDNTGLIEGSRLFAELRRRVILDADQTPEYADIRKAGHEGGDFVFVRATGDNRI